MGTHLTARQERNGSTTGRAARRRTFEAILAALVIVGSLGVPSIAATSPLAGGPKLGHTVVDPHIGPGLDVEVTPYSSDASPGTYTYLELAATNQGPVVSVRGKIDLNNGSTGSLRTVSWFSYLEYQSPAGEWMRLGTAGASADGYSPIVGQPEGGGLDLEASSQPAEGVTYPQTGDPILGTEIGPSRTGSWTYAASVPVAPGDLETLKNPQVKFVRSVLHVEVSGSAGASPLDSRRTTPLITTGTSTGGLTDVRVSVSLPDGEPQSYELVTAPDELAVGDTAWASADYFFPEIDPRGETESDAAYFDRLSSEDGRIFTFGAEASATAGDGSRVTAFPDREHATRKIPVLELDIDGPSASRGGDRVRQEITVSNVGSAEAGNVELDYETRRGIWARVGSLDGYLEPGSTTSLEAILHLPEELHDELRSSVTARWGRSDRDPAWGSDSMPAYYGPLTASTVASVTSVPIPVAPDSSEEAPPLDSTIPTSLVEATSFLYEGDAPIQRGVEPGTIEPHRAAVVRGRILGSQGQPLTGVRVNVLEHPELGRTFAQEDGGFDMAVNGGESLTLSFEKAGHLPVQREIQVPWQDYVVVDDVVLLPVDAAVTEVDASAPTLQVARASEVQDMDGDRRATLLFRPNTEAEAVFGENETAPLDGFHVRITEYTVGENGPEAMPASLPPTSAYTYAAEFSIDEAMDAGAEQVRFSKPVISYTENFLGFPVGGVVPSAYYDREQAAWVASDNGRVIGILGTSGGVADLDVDGSGNPATPEALAEIGITEPEREELAALYSPGQSLWRVPLSHFTPYDFNWPPGLPEGAVGPDGEAEFSSTTDEPCERPGSVIECQNQTLGEYLSVAGTSMRLGYRSDRVPGRSSARTVDVVLTGDSLPPNVKRVLLQGWVAGRQIQESFPPEPNLRYTVEWDEKDAYGRQVTGAQPVTIRIGFVYDTQYRLPAAVARSFGLPVTGSEFILPGRTERTLWQELTGYVGADTLGGWDARSQGLGGWNLDVHHAYDPHSRTLYYGDGSRRTADALDDRVITRTPHQGHQAYGIEVRPDGELAIHEQAWWNSSFDIGPDGRTYLSKPDAGTVVERTEDGEERVLAHLDNPTSLSVAPDGSIYVAAHRVEEYQREVALYRVAPGTEPRIVAGRSPFGEDPGIGEVEVGPDGSVYFVEYPLWNRDQRTRPGIRECPDEGCSGRVRKLSPDGAVTTLAGSFDPSGEGDGSPADTVRLQTPVGIAVADNGDLYIAEQQNPSTIGDPYWWRPAWIRRVGTDGIISTVAGGGSSFPGADGAPARQVSFESIGDIAVAPDGTLYVADPRRTFRIRKVTPALPGFDGGQIRVPSDDGREVYVFSASGRHLRTVDAFTDATIYAFDYADGLLSGVRDGDGNTVAIERAADGTPRTIVSPDGVRTNLTVDANGYLSSVSNEAAEATSLTYRVGGLLATLSTPGGEEYTFTYDRLGRLVKDQDPAGGFSELARVDTPKGYEATVTTATGRTTTHATEVLGTGAEVNETTDPAGLVTRSILFPDGSTRTTAPDGTVATAEVAPDPRWGMRSPTTARSMVLTPSGLRMVQENDRTVEYVDPENPFAVAAQVEQTSINGRAYVTRYDVVDRTVTSTTPEGRRTTEVLDERSRVVEARVPGLAPTHYDYDQRGRLTAMRQGDRITSYTYDGTGRLNEVRYPSGRTIGFDYDSSGRITRQVLSDGRAVGYRYDGNGNLTSLTPPSRAPYTFERTAVGLVRQSVAAAGSVDAPVTSFEYNASRDVTRMVLPDGRAVDYGYDAAGRLVSIAAGRGTTGLFYDGVTGALERMEDPDGGSLSFDHDGPLLTSTTATGAGAGSVAYSYDDSLRVTSERVNGGNGVSFTYDRDDLLIRAGRLDIERTPENGSIVGTALGSNDGSRRVVTRQALNPYGELAAFRASTGQDVLFDVTYRRDELGRVVEKTESVQGESVATLYEYDAAGRLESVVAGGATTTYSYDENGNRIAVDSGGVQASTYDGQDRLLTSDGASFTYDRSGDLDTVTDANGDTTGYDYDEFGNLRSVALPDGRAVTYSVDAMNRRTAKSIDGEVVQAFLYRSQLNPVAELDADGDVVSRFVYATRGSTPDYMVKDGTVYRIVSDHLGSPRLVVDTETGDVVQRLDYDEFGVVVEDTNPGLQPFGFAGGLYDTDTGLVRFGARDYDPALGRWTIKDPVGVEGGDTNLYAYVGNDPINATDPTGRNALSDLLTLPGDFTNMVFGGDSWHDNEIVNWGGWDEVGSFSSGWGDAASFGGTYWTRELFGLNDVIDMCSGAYKAGSIGGTVNSIAVSGGLGATRSVGLARTWNTSRFARGVTVGGKRYMVHAPHRVGELGHRGSWHLQVNQGKKALWRFPK